MTVSTTNNRVSYAGNGVTTVFSFPNKFLADADLVVLDVLDSTGAETTKTLTTHYTVSGAGDAAGGSVTMLTAPAAGHTLVIYRDPALTQPIDLVNGDPLNVETGIERGLDRLTTQVQRVRDLIDRSLHLPDGDTGFTAADMELPAEVVRANKYLAFDGNGIPTASTPTNANASVFMATMLDDTTAAEAQTTLGISAFMQTLIDAASAAAGLTTLGVSAFVQTILDDATSNAALTTLTATRAETGATAVPVLNKLREAVSVKDFGATGDGTTDDTAAIQAAITAIITTSGGHLFFPDGTYKITAELTIPLSSGWVIRGASRAGTVIRQATSDTRIFRLTACDTHSWHLSDFTLGYSVAQTTAETNSVCISMMGDTGTPSNGFYQYRIDRITFDKAYRCIATNPATGVSGWGGSFDQLYYNSTNSGAFIYLVPSPTLGQPNIRIGHIYALVSSAQETLVNLSGCGNMLLELFEVNTNSNGVAILKLANCTGVVNCIRQEGGTFDTSADRLIEYSDSSMFFGTVHLSSTTIAAGGGNKVYVLKDFGGATAGITVDHMQLVSNTLTSGTLYVVGATDHARRVTINRFDADTLDIAYLQDLDISGNGGVSVTDWLINRPSADNGDANLTITPGDENTQFFLTTLTANRTVTMPGAYNPSNVFDGLTYTIVRNNATPGAFTLDVGGVKTIPINTNAKVTLMYKRFGWLLVDYVVL